MIDGIRREIMKYADSEKAKLLGRYFKTGKGQYAEGDVFLGLMVPQSRSVAKMFLDLSQIDIEQLLHSKFHEERLIALFILIDQYKKGSSERKKEIFDFYLSNTKYINNWDLVDLSADKIVGEYLLVQNVDRLTKIVKTPPLLKELARSDSIWERRIAILSTFAHIRVGNADVTYAVADLLLHDKHDLIHKAVGWLLREAGKRVSQEQEEEFLSTRYMTMPRTMLRYAIERFPKGRRDEYLKGKV